jgi:molybdopterin converting factor small subunit
MNIEVWFFGRFRELAVRQRVAPLKNGVQLADLIHWLIEEYGVDFGEELKHTKKYYIMINGRYCDLFANKKKPLQDGDVVALLPILVGG